MKSHRFGYKLGIAELGLFYTHNFLTCSNFFKPKIYALTGVVDQTQENKIWTLHKLENGLKNQTKPNQNPTTFFI